MIFEGMKLMVVGMTTVMVFLLLMIFFMNIIAFLTRGVARREQEAIARERASMSAKRKTKQQVPAGDSDAKQEAPTSNGDETMAVVAAAVARYEEEVFGQA